MILAGLSGVLGFLGARSQKKAAARQASELMSIAKPYLDAGSKGLSGLQSLMTSISRGDSNRNPYIDASHRMTLDDIYTTKQRNLLDAAHYWKSQGNIGRGRGEELRISEQALNERSKANLAYGMEKRADQLDSLSRLMGGMQYLSSMGNIGAQLAAGAAGVRAEGSAAAASSIGAGLGSAVGILESDRSAKRQRDMLEMIYGSFSPNVKPSSAGANYGFNFGSYYPSFNTASTSLLESSPLTYKSKYPGIDEQTRLVATLFGR